MQLPASLSTCSHTLRRGSTGSVASDPSFVSYAQSSMISSECSSSSLWQIFARFSLAMRSRRSDM
ncbi:MAG: hypothetical protein ACO3QC_04765 [Phycisphaerales bacterium]